MLNDELNTISKETAMPVLYTGEYGATFGTKYYCPRCKGYHGHLLISCYHIHYCHNCGQRIDWDNGKKKED